MLPFWLLILSWRGHAAAHRPVPSKVNPSRGHDNAGPAGTLGGGCCSHTAARASPCQQHRSRRRSHLQPPVPLKGRSKRNELSLPLRTCEAQLDSKKVRSCLGGGCGSCFFCSVIRLLPLLTLGPVERLNYDTVVINQNEDAACACSRFFANEQDQLSALWRFTAYNAD